ncbi:MAG: FecR domain-containing protein [Bacteroidales bacterium]|nr:FecR domain-containing protein [Bacteroidales bacterium]
MENKEEHIEYETLIVRYLSNDITQEESEQLLAWLKQNPENIRELKKLRHTSTILHQKASVQFDADRAFSNFEKERISEPKKFSLRKIVYLTASVAALILLVIGLVIFNTNKSENELIILAETQDSITEFVLSDGSCVTLNSNAKITSINHFDKDHRKLSLEGEAFFEVVPNKISPFVVSVNNLTITVLGTSFNIFSDTISKKTVVTVKSGTVKVTHNTDSITINSGEQVTLNPTLTQSYTDIANCDAWKTGHIIFQNTKLISVVETLNKNFNTNFEIASPELKECKLIATFYKTDDIEKVKEVLSVVLRVEIKEENGKQLLYSLTHNEIKN